MAWAPRRKLFEVWTWGQLGYHAKPLGLLEVDGFYARLTDFLDHLVAERFVREQHRAILQVSASPPSCWHAWMPGNRPPRPSGSTAHNAGGGDDSGATPC